MNTNITPHTVVVGAGIVGVSTAIWLARSGHRVTLVDRLPPGEGTSHGNAGVLAACAMVPVTVPGLLPKVPGYLLSKNSPLFMRWSYLPRLSPWLARYMSHANDADTRHIAKHLTHVVGDSLAQHQDLAGNTVADKWLVPSDYQFAYKNRTEMAADEYIWSLRREHGFEPELIEGAAVREREPALSSDIELLAVLKQHGHIRSPGLYVKSLAEVFQQLGGELLQASLVDIELHAGRVKQVVTDQGEIACSSVVLATGVWSGPLAEKLGIKVPMESERGYHVILKDASPMVSIPTMIASGKFVATPMHDGMRCAGVVEFGGLEAAASKPPSEFLLRQIKQVFPSVQYSETEHWMGHRPAPADSLPLIGQIEQTGVYAGFGHHHIGLTAGPKTGRILAGLITGEENEADYDAYRPHRFNR